MSARRPTTGLPWPIVATTPVLATGCLQQDQAPGLKGLFMTLLDLGVRKRPVLQARMHLPWLQGLRVQISRLNGRDAGRLLALRTCMVCQAHPAFA